MDSVSRAKWEILISYARKETEEHALQLKEELTKKNLKVFLDVHEINGADDWADSLNNAIKNCKIFVPLVSPLYGITKWTNREVRAQKIRSVDSSGEFFVGNDCRFH